MAAVAVVVLAVACAPGEAAEPEPEQITAEQAHATVAALDFTRHDGGTSVARDGKRLAELTDGARTVLFDGPRRTFTEEGVAVTVTHDLWVRVAPRRYEPGAETQPWFEQWLAAQLDSDEPDVLAAAMQYVTGGPADAGFGLFRDADTVDGADFYDGLGMDWTFADGEQRTPDPQWLGRLDCSGYLRVVYGYHAGVPMLAGTDSGDVAGLPRTANAMSEWTGAPVVAEGTPPELAAAQPGDLVFFSLREPGKMSHSGIYLGRDQHDGMRFLSSRGYTDGPSMGDLGAEGVIDSGYFGAQLRRIVRL